MITYYVLIDSPSNDQYDEIERAAKERAEIVGKYEKVCNVFHSSSNRLYDCLESENYCPKLKFSNKHICWCQTTSIYTQFKLYIYIY